MTKIKWAGLAATYVVALGIGAAVGKTETVVETRTETVTTEREVVRVRAPRECATALDLSAETLDRAGGILRLVGAFDLERAAEESDELSAWVDQTRPKMQAANLVCRAAVSAG